LISDDHLWLLALALVIDAALGDPAFLWQRLPHPVAMIGRLIGVLDRKLNREDHPPTRRKVLGVIALVLVVKTAAIVGWGLESLFSSFAFGWVGTVIIVAVMLAGRSLYDHVAAVATGFANGGIDAARAALAKIVGRDPESLDEAGISRAAIETTAENFSDGLVAPALWFALLGLPGLLAYKAINTADSMIGHLSPRYRDFGWAAARLDDLVNWPAARLSGLLIAVAAPLGGGSFGKALGAMRADAGKHRSPNAGWPEAAMAAALGVSLAGPRSYDGKVVDDAFINASGREPALPDIRKALRVYVGAWLAFVLGVVLVSAMTV
jgi:adenosylcobinamide-phosphate synthase